MRRLFCYTLSARAIGATVSAGALHAQGWGFESLIAHHGIGNGPRKGTVFVWAHRRGIRTRKGAELRKREAFSSAAREGRRPEAKAGGVSRTRHPSSPTIELETVLARGPFCLRPFHGIRTRQGAELRKHEAFSSAAREERSDEAGRGRRQPHADIPHRPPLNCLASSDGGLSFFGAIAGGFEP